MKACAAIVYGAAIASMPGSNSQSLLRLAAIGPVTRASRRPTIRPRSRSRSKNIV